MAFTMEVKMQPKDLEAKNQETARFLIRQVTLYALLTGFTAYWSTYWYWAGVPVAFGYLLPIVFMGFLSGVIFTLSKHRPIEQRASQLLVSGLVVYGGIAFGYFGYLLAGQPQTNQLKQKVAEHFFVMLILGIIHGLSVHLAAKSDLSRDLDFRTNILRFLARGYSYTALAIGTMMMIVGPMFYGFALFHNSLNRELSELQTANSNAREKAYTDFIAKNCREPSDEEYIKLLDEAFEK